MRRVERAQKEMNLLVHDQINTISKKLPSFLWFDETSMESSTEGKAEERSQRLIKKGDDEGKQDEVTYGHWSSSIMHKVIYEMR